MDQYSYVITFVSIILGVAVAKSLEAIGRPLKSGNRSDLYPLHMMAGSLLILLIVQYWWGSFDERNIESWAFPQFLQFLLTPLLFYFTADTLTPEGDGEGTKAYYWQHIRTTQLVMAILIANNSLTDILWPEMKADVFIHGVRGVTILVLVGMACSRSEKLHFAGYIFFYFALAAFIALTN